MKGCLIEDVCLHAERVKGSEALHGSAHSQECLAYSEHSLFACGEAWENKFFYLLPCQDKQMYYMELVRGRRKLGSFLLQLWQSTSESKDFASSPGPRSCTGLCTSWQCLGCLRKAVPKNYLACSWVPAISGFSQNCLQMCTSLSLMDTSIPQLTRQPLKWVYDLAVLSVFRVFCSSLPLTPFCPQWDLSAFRYSVSKSKGSPILKPPFSCNITITEEMRCYLFGLTGLSSGVISERWWWQWLVSSPPWLPSAQHNWPFSPGHNWAGLEIMDQLLPLLWRAASLSSNANYPGGLF